MDACLWVVVGSFIIQQVTALSCIECTHIIWNATDRDLHIQRLGEQNVTSSWIGTIDKALRVKERFNPACAAKDPVGSSKYNPTSDPTPRPTGTIVNQTCPAFSEQEREKERCNHMHGNVDVYVKTHDREICHKYGVPCSKARGRQRKTWSDCVKADMNACSIGGIDPQNRTAWRSVKLDVHVRNCGQADSASEMDDDCVEINTQTDSSKKAQNVANFFENNVLSFLGYGTDVLSFVGEQCLCTSSPCPRPPPSTTPNPNAGTSKHASFMASVLIAMLAMLAVLVSNSTGFQ